MRIALASPILLLLIACSSGSHRSTSSEGQPASVDEMCKLAQCGYDIRVELKREDGSVFSRVFDVMPVVQESGVSVYAGSIVHFEADVLDGKLTDLRLVKEVVNPERTITSKLEQDDNGQMMLVTSNPFDRNLKIRMGMMPLGHDGLVRTSSCPVVSGGSSFEMWPYPIFQVFLGEMWLMDADEPMACVE